MDTGVNRDDYAALGIAEYWRFDETGEHHGDRLAEGRYEPIAIAELPEGSLQGYSTALNLNLRWETDSCCGTTRPPADPSSPTRTKESVPIMNARYGCESARAPRHGSGNWKRKSAGFATNSVAAGIASRQPGTLLFGR